jgi:hypothetical protein
MTRQSPSIRNDGPAPNDPSIGVLTGREKPGPSVAPSDYDREYTLVGELADVIAVDRKLMQRLFAAADEIRREHLEAAIALADYGRRSAVWALGASTGNRHADVLLRMLADGPVPWSDARSALGLRMAADMAEAVAVLTGADLAEVVEESRDGGGRPPRVIRAKRANHAKDAGAARTEEKGITT